MYDARALRVVVDDFGGKSLADAVQCCYRLISAVHKLWHPIHGEFDDYIANPKPSGYQALHTAVWGPGGAALEVQIKTSGMHEHAEYGGAAHWAYKEVLWGSAPAAAAAVNALVLGSSDDIRSDRAQTAVAAAAAAIKGPVQSLPSVTFTFSGDGSLLSSTSLAPATAAAASSSSTGTFFDVESENVASIPAVAAVSKSRSTQDLAQTLFSSAFRAGAVSSTSKGRTATATATATASSTAKATATAVAERHECTLLDRVAALSREQQAQEPSPAAAAAALRARSSGSVQTLPRLGGSSSGRLQQELDRPSQQFKLPPEQQQQQELPMHPAGKVYVGQPILRISDRLRYGVVLAVIDDSSSSSGASASPTPKPWTASSSSRATVLCVIMSGGTNPDHPWRMPDYGFYHQLLQYAGAAGWFRPGEGDWHARIEEFEWCRDGRWHRRDHMGYLHPHTTLTLLEGYEHDAGEAAATTLQASISRALPDPAVAAVSAAGASSSSSSSGSGSVGAGGATAAVAAVKVRERKNPRLLLHSWATGGSWLPAQTAAALSDDSNSSSSSSGGETSLLGTQDNSSKQQQQQAAGSGENQSTAAAAAAAIDDVGSASAAAATAGSDWAATAAKAAQLRSVVEWGLEAYGLEEQQGSEVSVLVWPGGA